jgi:N-acetylglucosamine-6-phosphate deacetylase
MNKKLITNGKIIALERIIPVGSISVCDGLITGVYEGIERLPEPDETVVDAGGKYISPGFLDIHVHGGGGYGFLRSSVDDVISCSKAHMKHGTTSIVPTISSATNELIKESLENIKEATSNMTKGPEILGVHIEGPYFAMSQKGGQAAEYVRNPIKEEYMSIVDSFDNILRWSLAPELPGAHEMANELRKREILLSIGHSDALFDETIKAYECGFTTVTHLYSCTSTVRRINAYRFAGIIEAAFLLDGMMVEIIADGKHLPASLLKLVYKIKGPERTCLVTDAIDVAGLKDVKGEIYSQISDMNIIIEDDVAKLPDRLAFAGSVATTDRLVRNMINLADVPLYQAVKMMTATPAKNIGMFSTKGSLSTGKDADIIIFDDDINVSTVIVGGEVTFKNN